MSEVHLKTLRKSESSPLQLNLSLGKTESAATENETDKQLLKLDEVDLLELIYELKYNGVPEDEAFLKAAQRELQQRRNPFQA